MELSEYENPWTYQGKPIGSADIEGSYGFVYLISDTLSDKKYIGKKLFWSRKTKVVKKKKKRTLVESDWQTYYGSNLELIAEVDKSGGSRFKREILHLCKSKGECNYWEAQEQFARNVLLDDSYYNSWIMVKVHRSHLKNVKAIDPAPCPCVRRSMEINRLFDEVIPPDSSPASSQE